MTFLQEPSWITAFQEGDVDAFSSLYKELYRRLNYFAYTLTQDKTQAEDIATESFVQLWNKKESFHTFTTIKSYLYITARHASIDYIRAEKRHNTSHKELRYLQDEADLYINHEIIDAEIISEIYKQVQMLPPQCAEVFKLIYFEGKSTAEAATILKITSKTVLNQKLKALKLLKALLLKKGLLSLLVIIQTLK